MDEDVHVRLVITVVRHSSNLLSWQPRRPNISRGKPKYLKPSTVERITFWNLRLMDQVMKKSQLGQSLQAMHDEPKWVTARGVHIIQTLRYETAIGDCIIKIQIQ